MNVIASQMSCGAKNSGLSGGNTFECPASCGTSVPAVTGSAMVSSVAISRHQRLPKSGARKARPWQPFYHGSGEEQEERDEEGEDAQGFRHGEAEDQAAELPVGGRRIAQRALQELAEQVADADGGSSRADGGEAGADQFGGGG